MPIYLYKHPETDEIKEIFQSMTEPHEYCEDGVNWMRIFTKPNASIDTKINEFSQADYVNKTSNKKGTVGDLLDLSSELSRKRSERDGVDKVQQKFFKDYEKNVGVKHSYDKKKVIEKNGVKVDLTGS